MFRQLPPVATPLPLSTWMAAPLASRDASQRFRDDFAQWLGVPACFLASSGRTALYLTLRALATQQPTRREVVMPAYTCPSLAKVVLEAGLKPHLVDIHPHSLAMDHMDLANALSQRTLAVIWVHPFGIPQPLGDVLESVHAQGALLIEDVAQSMGAAWCGRRAGAHGDFGLFSLGPGKPISAGGGGIISANSVAGEALLARVWRRLPAASTGASCLAWLRLTAFNLAFEPVGWWFASRLGAQKVGDQEASWGFRLSGLTASQAAVARAQLARLDAINDRRRRQAAALAQRLRVFDFVDLPQETEPSPVAALTAPPVPPHQVNEVQATYLRFPLLAPTEDVRDRLVDWLQAAGTGAGRMYRRTIAEFFPQLAARPYLGAQEAARRLLTLPTHHHLDGRDLDRIVAVFERADFHLFAKSSTRR